ncbi:MAG: polysaccharide deacetylase family protein [Candidatus Cryosericum sp.]
MKRKVALLIVLLILAVVPLSGCRFTSSAASEPYPYGSQTPRTTPALKAPATVPANVDPNLSIPILMYHDVARHMSGMDAVNLSLLVEPGQFVQQMQYLKDRGFTTITLDDWMAARAGRETLPRNPVVLTFDDGRLGVFQNAFPVLKRNGQKAILFLITAEVGRVVKGYLDWSMVREMQNTGLITFGSHTVHHAVLPLLTAQRAMVELSYSKMVIQRNTGRPCEYFCYPHGKYDARDARLVAIAGYHAAVTEIPGRSRVTDNPYELRRVRVDGRDTMSVFRAELGPGR